MHLFSIGAIAQLIEHETITQEAGVQLPPGAKIFSWHFIQFSQVAFKIQTWREALNILKNEFHKRKDTKAFWPEVFYFQTWSEDTSHFSLHKEGKSSKTLHKLQVWIYQWLLNIIQRNFAYMKVVGRWTKSISKKFWSISKIDF